MKRKLFILIMLLVLASTAAGCGEHVHSFGEWTVTKAPTCTENGSRERVCACGEKETETVDAKGHDWGEWSVTVAPTCTTPGERKRVCACGEEETETVETVPHEWTEASCLEAKKCSVCGMTEGMPLGHDGKLGGACSRCGEKIVFTVLTPKLPVEVWMEQDNVTRIDTVNYEITGEEIIFTVNMTKLNELKGNAYNGFIYRLYDRNGKLLAESPVTRMDSLVGTAYDVSWKVRLGDLELDPDTTMIFLELRDFIWEEE
ncbi:MAG: hypothetical protein J6112_01615 [Clostridia bacterium]|nr:hypothetical protein [Clostridia bacterium]